MKTDKIFVTGWPRLFILIIASKNSVAHTHAGKYEIQIYGWCQYYGQLIRVLSFG